MGDLNKAKKIAKKLKNDLDFYKNVCKLSRSNYNKYFSESVYIQNMKKIFKKIVK